MEFIFYRTDSSLTSFFDILSSFNIRIVSIRPSSGKRTLWRVLMVTLVSLSDKKLPDYSLLLEDLEFDII